jgi:hypothetical protein
VWLNVVSRKSCMYFSLLFIFLYSMTKFQFIVDVAWIRTLKKIYNKQKLHNNVSGMVVLRFVTIGKLL